MGLLRWPRRDTWGYCVVPCAEHAWVRDTRTNLGLLRWPLRTPMNWGYCVGPFARKQEWGYCVGPFASTELACMPGLGVIAFAPPRNKLENVPAK